MSIIVNGLTYVYQLIICSRLFQFSAPERETWSGRSPLCVSSGALSTTQKMGKSASECYNCLHVISLFRSLQWRHNAHNDVSNQRHIEYLFNRLFGHRSKEISRLCVTGLCERASNAENVSTSWHHHVSEIPHRSKDRLSSFVHQPHNMRLSIWDLVAKAFVPLINLFYHDHKV